MIGGREKERQTEKKRELKIKWNKRVHDSKLVQ